MVTDIIAEEFIDEPDEAAEAIALAVRLSGLLRRGELRPAPPCPVLESV